MLSSSPATRCSKLVAFPPAPSWKVTRKEALSNVWPRLSERPTYTEVAKVPLGQHSPECQVACKRVRLSKTSASANAMFAAPG